MSTNEYRVERGKVLAVAWARWLPVTPTQRHGGWEAVRRDAQE